MAINEKLVGRSDLPTYGKLVSLYEGGEVSLYVFSNSELSDKEINLIQNNNYDTAREIHNLKRFKPEVRAANKADLLSLFKCQIWAKEVENSYSKDHVNSPWLIVYTKIGPIKIGWRSSVISIDWEESDNKTPAAELFPGEECTKYGRLIHAWGLEKARDYVGRIVGE